MAILGSLILLALSVLLTYGQRLQLQQQLKMDAFRNAMQKAYERNSSASYTLKKDVRMFNLFTPFGVGQQSTVGASASVMWQKGMPGEPGSEKQVSYAFYQINDQMIGDPDTGLPRLLKHGDINPDNKTEGRDIEVPVSIWKEDRAVIETYTAGVEKTETPGNIKNKRYADLENTKVTTKIHTRFDASYAKKTGERPLPQYVYEGNSYSYGGETRKVNPVDPVTQRAYRNLKNNRVEYSKDTPEGDKVHIERTWETSN